MGKLVSKIVLTGGPCAGKTTALKQIEEELTLKGYKVLVVPESATELISSGIRPFGKAPIEMFKFQEIIMKHQVHKDKMFEEAVLGMLDDEQCVIIYDRGAIDNKAYIGQELFDTLLDNLNLKEDRLLENYDMVIHLVTAAVGAIEYYTLENNQARSETVEEAIALDKKTVEAWVGHNNLNVVDNSTLFEEKLKRTMNIIYSHLNFGSPEYGFLNKINEETPKTKELSF